MLLTQIVQPTSPRGLDSVGPMLWVIAHTEVFFFLLLIGLMLVVEFGYRLRSVSHAIDPERQSLVESARNELGILLGLLLGFSLPMALSHYEHRNQLVIDEANAITTVRERAEMLPEPFRNKILSLLGEYVSARIEFCESALNPHTIVVSIDHAKQLQNDMLRETRALVRQSPNAVTPLFVQALDKLPELAEQRLAAEEKHVPVAIWLVMILIATLTCFVVGYGMRRRFFLGMLVVPLMVAIVLSLASELDNPRTGIVHDNQQSIERLYLNLASVPTLNDQPSGISQRVNLGDGPDPAAENVVASANQRDHRGSTNRR